MKTLGLIGGLSWYSTRVYYRTINKLINERLGGSNAAKLILYSVNFEEFRLLQEDGNWEQIEKMITDIAQRLETAGAECLVMCTNTPHLVADQVSQNISIPLLHIAEETAKEIVRVKKSNVGLLGTKFTMENSFFKERLSGYGIKSVIPENSDRDYIHDAVFNELTKGVYNGETKNKFLEIIEKMRMQGLDGVIFACTEISLLINQSDCNISVFDTTDIHAKSAVDFALQ